MRSERVLLESDLENLLSEQTQELIRQYIRESIDDLLQEGLEAGLNIRSVLIEREAAELIASYRLVTCDPVGKIIRADWAHPEVLGLITKSVDAGEKTQVLVFGVAENPDWDFDLKRPIVLGNDGKPVQAFTASFSVITRVGRPLAKDSFLTAIESPIK
jgi:hypothetical protein